MYGSAIDQIIFRLEKAIPFAENPTQQQALTLLADYYRTGDLHTWDESNKSWVQDTTGAIAFAKGFIEVYNDSMGTKGSYEAVLSCKDLENTKSIKAIADEAQWFEDNAHLRPKNNKKEEKNTRD